LNIDTVGRLADGKVTIFGTGSARELPFIFMGAGAVTGVPTQAVAQEINASDHTAFVEAGVPACSCLLPLRATTTAVGHSRQDRLCGIGQGCGHPKEAADYLAARAEPLNFSGNAPAAQSRGPAAATTTRRVATGIVPDMTHQGEGVRVGGVQPGSGAEIAGLKPGDGSWFSAASRHPT